MTNEEKRRLAVARELEELARIAEGFATIAHNARKEADELALWAQRMDKLRRDEEIDRKLEELEELAAFRRKQRELDFGGLNIVDISTRHK